MNLDDEAHKDDFNLPRQDNPQPDSQHSRQLPPISEKQDKHFNTPFLSSTNKQKTNSQLWQQKGFATYTAQHKFTTGLSRISTLATRYPKQAPHLQSFRRCLEALSFPLDSQRTRMDGEIEDEEVDVEKSRVWKFRFLDLIIEMLLQGEGMADKEVRNVLVYAETVMREFRESLNVKGNENA